MIRGYKKVFDRAWVYGGDNDIQGDVGNGDVHGVEKGESE